MQDGNSPTCDDGIRRVGLRDLASPVVERLLRDRGQALLLAEVAERQAHQAAVAERPL